MRTGFSDSSGDDSSSGDREQRLVTVTRAVEALRWAVSVATNSGLQKAVRLWRGRCRKITGLPA